MKKVFTMSILIFLIFLVAGGCKQKARRIITGEPVVVTTETIGPEGGTITINKEGDPLNGYSITVPEGAYAESQSFTVSYRPILDHTYGENFNPIAPLITVENGGGYAKKSMVVKIPVEVPEDHFAMAFFYDDKTGELQGVSMRKSEKNLLTVATKHFSNMAVSSAAKKVFEGEIPSGFEQGVDNWQFTNRGSYVAAGGQCAGQTIAAMYYYSEKKVKEKKPSLFGLYDNYNNPYQKTPDIEFDDVLAYRLCSMAQEETAPITWGEAITDLSVLFSDATEEDLDPESTFHAFAGSMVVSDMPQLMGVWKKDKNDKRIGHALIVYKCSGNELYVSDPNYPSGPGSKDRKVIYDPVAKQFKGYDIARNAGEAGEHFDNIEYMGALTTFDTAPIKKLWKEFEDGTIGDGTFPRYTIVVEETFPDGNTADIGLIDNYETTNQKIKVYIDPTDFEPQVTLYRGTPPPAQKDVTITGTQTIEIPLSEGVNSLGFHVEGKVKEGAYAGRYVWVGFTWVNVIRKKAASTTTTTVEATTSSSSSTTTTTTDGTSNRLIWSYDLGGGRHVSHSPVVADGKVYFTTYIDGGVDLNSGVFCLDAATGNLVWKYDPDEFPVGTYQPLVTGGKVFVTTFHGYNHANVACLDAANGSLLWEKDVTDTGSPFSFANDLVYAGSYRHLYALQPASGEFAWYTNNVIFASALTTPAVVGDYLYTTDGAGNVYCVQYKKGEPEDNWKKWTFSAGASYTAAPSVANGKVYVSNSDLKIFCLDALSGQKVWELAGAGCSSSRALAVVGDKIYTSQNNKAVCTSTGGSNVWETPLGTESSDVAVSDLYVYVATRDYSDHKLLCINAGTGAVVWEYAADNFSMYGDPVVSGGFVYIGCDKNKICCLQAEEGDSGSWPMYKYNVSRTSAK